MSTSYAPTYAPRFLVSVGGTDFHEYSGYVTDVVVDTTVDGANHCSFTLVYPFDHEQVDFTGLDWDVVSPGSSIEISMGYGGRGSTLETLFVGSVYGLEPEFPVDRPPSVRVYGYGPLREMMTGTKSRSWEDVSIGSVVDEVVSPHFGSVVVESADLSLDYLYQDKQSDYRFVADLADKYGFECFSALDTCFFRPNDGGSIGDPVATLYYGESLEMFTAELSRAELVGEVEVRHWDPKRKEEIVGTAPGHPEATGKEVYRVPVESQAEANTIAETMATQETVTGSGETFGVPEITAGSTISIEGIGDKFTDTYYVTDATHRIGGSGYQLSFEVRRYDD